MTDNFERVRGRSSGYNLDRGGAIVSEGVFIAEVRNNVDTTRTGRLQVWIEEFSAVDKNDPASWITVQYMSPFYGTTQHSGTSVGTGSYVGNRHSYGFWFTPPDIGTKVLVCFASGDANKGFYLGCIPQSGLTHMVPAMGSTKNLKRQSPAQDQLFADIDQLPVTEINDLDPAIDEHPRFFAEDKPVHSYLAAVLHQQGLVRDTVRGTIGSSSQRESPSRVFGVSSPGRPIYEGGLTDDDVREKVSSGAVQAHEFKVVGRRHGHSFVLDDGDLDGNDQLVRIRTSKGHQILLSDDGDSMHFIHANGHTWFELGKEGTIDFFSTNSVNIRSQGEINLHADKDVNIHAKKKINMVAEEEIQVESDGPMNFVAQKSFTAQSKSKMTLMTSSNLAVKANSTMALSADGVTSITGSKVNLNSGGAASVSAPKKLKRADHADTIYNPAKGWESKPTQFKSVTTRAPTHEPYEEHNKGVSSKATATGKPPPSTTPATRSKIDSAPPVSSVGTITTAEYLGTPKANAGIGELSADQLTGVMAQQAKKAAQAVDAISEKGIGKFGISIPQLETSGFLKPGVVEKMQALGDAGTSLLSSASSWTGKGGIENIEILLSSESLQGQVVQEMMQEAMDTLKNLNVLTGLEAPEDLAGMISASVTYGVGEVQSWVQGNVSSVTAQIADTVAAAKQAVGFVQNALPDTLASVTESVNHVGTIVRDVVDASTVQIVNNPKVPQVKYVASDSTMEP